jgi:hypothetical protein
VSCANTQRCHHDISAIPLTLRDFSPLFSALLGMISPADKRRHQETQKELDGELLEQKEGVNLTSWKQSSWILAGRKDLSSDLWPCDIRAPLHTRSKGTNNGSVELFGIIADSVPSSLAHFVDRSMPDRHRKGSSTRVLLLRG